MNTSGSTGIDRSGLDAAFASDEQRKSELLLTARLLRSQGQAEAAAERFAEAAGMEEQLSDRAAAVGRRDKAWVHRFSAACCWAQAGDFFHALVWCNRLLAEERLPERLRQTVSKYAATLRERRAKWYSEVEHAGTMTP